MLGSDPLMARHRKRPDSRQEAHGRDGVPVPPEATDRRLGSAMRRVVVTPTFAAGLGVVVAAVLAYPVQTVFSYVAPGALGRGGVPCSQAGCGQEAGTNARHAPSGTGGASRSGAAGQDSDGPATTSSRTGSGGITALPELSYKITSKWQGGFWGRIIITFPGAVPADWHLRFGYPGGRILGMNPDSRLAPNGRAVLVRSSDYATGTGRDGRTFAIGVGVQGVPTHPARCSFDGTPCHIR